MNRRKFIRNTSLSLIAATLHIASDRSSFASGQPLVVRISDPDASGKWDYSKSAPWDHTAEPRTSDDLASGKFRQDRYFDFINGDVVGKMVRRGLLELTASVNMNDAWKRILVGYQPGHRITIKINVNNASYSERVTTNRMDQTAPLIHSIVSELTGGFGVPEEHITVADPSRWIHPEILIRRCAFKNIRWVDSRSPDLWDERESVRFTRHMPVRPDKAGMSEMATFYLAKVYTEADHVINLCLLKNHGCGITGAMKNHFGAIQPPSPKFLHEGLGEKSYIADVCNAASIKGKVRLNVCDAIFANWHDNVWSPRSWKTFSGGSPNSLFFGIDPVAFDSVLLQHVSDEVEAQGDDAPRWVREAVTKHQFLHYAMDDHRLGIHEHKPFTRIAYREIELA